MRQRILSLIIIPILFLAACTSTPVPPQPEQPTDEVEVQVEAEPTSTPAPVPPMVLQSSPAVGEEQALDAPVELVFDQPMDRDSVEKAFAIEPGASADGTFEWVDDQTVRFSPADGFERGERYRVRIVDSAESQEGLTMAQPFELRFSAVGFLEVANVQPADGAEEILADNIVTVLFNRPVVSLSAIEDEGSLPDPLTFVPPVTGEGEWLNTSIYQFTPDEGFEAATEYTARVSAGLTDALGNASLEDDFEWAFTTVTPQVVASLPGEGDVYVSPSPVISVTFNQAMDRDSVEEQLTLVNDATAETVSGTFNWVEGGIKQPLANEYETYYDYEYEDGDGPEEVGVETVEFTPDEDLEFGTVYRIELPQGTQGSIGEAVTPRDFSATFTVVPVPEIVSTYPEDGAEGVEPWQSLQITFNTPINPDSVVIGENVIIEPTVSVTQVYTYWWGSNTNLEISFPTEASTRYNVTLGRGIEGRYGQPLAPGTEVAWETRAQSPLVYLHSPGRIATYNAYTDTVAYVSVRNVSQVTFKLYRMPLADFIRLNGNNWWNDWDSYSGSDDPDDLLAEWSLTSKGQLDGTLIYKVDIGRQSGLGSAMPPGMYYLEASSVLDDVYPEAQSSQDLYNMSARQMLVVSRNNLTFKSSTSEALAWLTDLESGQPVEDVPITFLKNETSSGQLGQAATDDEGVAQVQFDRLENYYDPRFAFAGDPDDPDENFAVTVSNWADGIERYQFDNVSVEDYQQPYNANIYTDRNI
ncbi:MAG: Ig-like domain-containing protein, partial [Anaerolineae bacterium]|nr:Ig-like domain-containing protein [Anaerolineae bacterium]